MFGNQRKLIDFHRIETNSIISQNTKLMFKITESLRFEPYGLFYCTHQNASVKSWRAAESHCAARTKSAPHTTELAVCGEKLQSFDNSPSWKIQKKHVFGISRFCVFWQKKSVECQSRNSNCRAMVVLNLWLKSVGIIHPPIFIVWHFIKMEHCFSKSVNKCQFSWLQSKWQRLEIIRQFVLPLISSSKLELNSVCWFPTLLRGQHYNLPIFW